VALKNRDIGVWPVKYVATLRRFKTMQTQHVVALTLSGLIHIIDGLNNGVMILKTTEVLRL
jgi:hypothetical protein